MGNATPEKWSKTPASNGTADTDSAFPTGMQAGTLDDRIRALMSGIANLLDDQGGFGVTAGSSTAYTLTSAQDIAALADGLRVHVVFDEANTGAATFSLNGLTAKQIYKATSSGMTALSAADIVADMHGILEYDASLNAAAGVWVLLNPAPQTASIPANLITAAATFATDNRALRSDGTSRGAQASNVTIDDSGNVSGVANLTITGTLGAASFSLSGAFAAGATTITGDLGVTGNVSINSTDASASGGPFLVFDRNSPTPAASDLLGSFTFRGRSSSAASRDYMRAYAGITSPTNGAEIGYLTFGGYSGGATADILVIFGAAAANNAGIGSDNAFAMANASPARGWTAVVGGAISVRNSGGASLNAGRVDDGTIVTFYGNTTAQGSISVSGTTVAYNTFAGGHYGRFINGERVEVKRGTIMQTAEGLIEWPGATGDVLPNVDFAEERTRHPYGVFMAYDDDDDFNDFTVIGLGAFVVRMAPGQMPELGDWIMAGPNSCGVVMNGNEDTAFHIAKLHVATITGLTRIDTYDDGSFTLPATIHCG